MTAPRTKSSASSAAGSSRREDNDDAKPYVLSTEIGKGSFATVYKGYHEDSRKRVAIKAVKREKLSPKLLDNLQSEIHILKALSHRHITKLIEIVRSDRYILTNYIKKRGRVETLEYIPRAAPKYYPHPPTGGLDEIVVRSFLWELARALKFLQHRNLIHRDIKPQNLPLNPAPPSELARGHPLSVPILKVADFGFARSLPNAGIPKMIQKEGIWRPVMPEHRKVIPPEVLDENAMIRPSRLNFRRTSTLGKDGEGSPPPAETPLPYVVDFFQ
ncbi:kinase-like protein [Dendrothele bispora CBS 962.96]|uniref:non-specific serine/threonine protein kinase n=1 Tax=Dendrothele bispora (strain CBS 962.96) TaxID=1314807 RepID=A0A4S8LTW2_DENBC|nr:kinase-like protein [Dendrothele bispora CBS 962.96]